MKTFTDFGIDLNGKTGVEVKTTCPQCSASRKKKNYPCLNVNTNDGVWHCWHCSWSGSIKSGEYERPQIVKPVEYRRPDFVPNPTGLPEKLLAWFAERCITPSVLVRNKIAYGPIYMPQVEEETNAVQFPYYRGDAVINIKYRDGRKNFRMAAGAERILYGLNDIAATTLICEGEMDKLALEVAGFPNAVSVPDGAPAADSKNYANKFDFLNAPELEKVERFIIAVDNDAPGARLSEEIIRRLGPEKCLTVEWSSECKDANDVLQTYGAEVLRECIEFARPVPIVGAFEAEDFFAAVMHNYEHGIPGGLHTGWHTLDPYYTVRPGEWTLVTGIPGHGKSEWLDALAVNLARMEGWSFGVYSPENQPVDYHIIKVLEKYVGKPFGPGPHERITREELTRGMAWVNQNFKWILPDIPTLDALLTTAKSMVKRYGIRGLILDPWNEIEHQRPKDMTETEHISICLGQIRRFARSNGLHIWIVAHPTKLQKDKDGKYPVPTPYDVSGAAHWRNKADNCIAIWRDLADDTTRDVEVHIQKVRFKAVGRVGQTVLQYNRVTGQYKDMPANAADYRRTRGDE